MQVTRLLAVAVLCFTLVSGMMMGKKKSKRGKSMRMKCMMKYNELKENFTELQTKVDVLSNPVHVHVHGITDKDDDVMVSSNLQLDHEHEHSHGKGGEPHSHPHKTGYHGDQTKGHDHSEEGHMKKSQGHRMGGGHKHKKQRMEEEEEEDSDENDSSEEEHEEETKGTTHVHIRINLGDQVADMLAKRKKYGGEEEVETSSCSKNTTMDKAACMKVLYPQDEYAFARCDMIRNSASTTRHNVRGSVFLRQAPGLPIRVSLDLYGFDTREIRDNPEDPRHLHGFHVHQFGDFSNGCNSFAGHYSPEGHVHGGPHSDERHAGDWGNIECDHRGVAKATFNESSSTLFGPNSIIGRGIVIHERADDHGLGGTKASRASGDAGGRIACCVISWAKGMW